MTGLRRAVTYAAFLALGGTAATAVYAPTEVAPLGTLALILAVLDFALPEPSTERTPE